MKDAGFVWDEKTLDRFIANPDETVPGKAMKPMEDWHEPTPE